MSIDDLPPQSPGAGPSRTSRKHERSKRRLRLHISKTYGHCSLERNNQNGLVLRLKPTEKCVSSLRRPHSPNLTPGTRRQILERKLSAAFDGFGLDDQPGCVVSVLTWFRDLLHRLMPLLFAVLEESNFQQSYTRVMPTPCVSRRIFRTSPLVHR